MSVAHTPYPVSWSPFSTRTSRIPSQVHCHAQSLEPSSQSWLLGTPLRQSPSSSVLLLDLPALSSSDGDTGSHKTSQTLVPPQMPLKHFRTTPRCPRPLRLSFFPWLKMLLPNSGNPYIVNGISQRVGEPCAWFTCSRRVSTP